MSFSGFMTLKSMGYFAVCKLFKPQSVAVMVFPGKINSGYSLSTLMDFETSNFELDFWSG